MELKIATRKQVKLKVNLSGPSGSGKTMSALLLAYGMVGDWSKIGVIDTENGSASLYAHLGPFLVLDLSPPFSPERYSQALDACIKAGIEAVIVDSASHEWICCIDDNDKLAIAKYRGNTWSAWSETTPRHEAFITKVLQAPAHVIFCTRSKTETVMGEDKKVKKVGMKDIQRDNLEYEWSLALSIDRDSHMAVPSKDRTRLFEGSQPFLINEETGRKLIEWCLSGAEPVQEAIDTLLRSTSMDELKTNWAAIGESMRKRPECLATKEKLKVKLEQTKSTAKP